MAPHEPETLAVGPHEFRFNPPDRIHFVMGKVFDDAHARVYLDFIFTHASRPGTRLYASYELSKLERVTSAARRRIIHIDRPYPLGGLAIVGASFTVRTLASMILSAGRLLAPGFFDFPHRFVATLEQANAWFDTLRAKSLES